jgi:hypothetical protein
MNQAEKPLIIVGVPQPPEEGHAPPVRSHGDLRGSRGSRADKARDHLLRASPYKHLSPQGAATGPICQPRHGVHKGGVVAGRTPATCTSSPGDGTPRLSTTIEDHNRAISSRIRPLKADDSSKVKHSAAFDKGLHGKHARMPCGRRRHDPDIIEQILMEEGLTSRRFHRAEDSLFIDRIRALRHRHLDSGAAGMSGMELLERLNDRGLRRPFRSDHRYASLDSAIAAVNRGRVFIHQETFQHGRDTHPSSIS